MKLISSFKTAITILVLSIILLLISFLVAFKNITNKDFLKEKKKDFDIVNYVKNRQYIKSNNKYPKEVFDYIDMSEYNEVIDKMIDNLHNDSKILLDKESVSDMLFNAVREYDLNNDTDSIAYVKDDINRFSSELSYKLNNNIIVGVVKTIVTLVNSVLYYFLFVAVFLLMFCIIYFEKRNGYIINAIIMLLYSIYLYYFNYMIIQNTVVEGNIYSYIKDVNKITLGLENFYIICFISSFILLLIYIIKYIRKIIRDAHIKSYTRW